MLITADRLFDGREFREPGAVLVRGETVVAVGASIDAEAARTIDLGDATILPGFIDLHVHAEAQMLRGGVTTVRDLAAPLSTLRPAGRHRGLRVLMAGPMVAVAGGYPSTVWGSSIALNVRDADDARRAVRLLARRGAAVIKVSLEPGNGAWPMLSATVVRAIVDVAHRHDLTVTAHAMGPEGIRRALDRGVDELAHVPCGATEELMRGIVEQQIEVVGTLHVVQVRSGGCGHVASRLVGLGARLLYGSDVGNQGIPLGIDVSELRLLRGAGLRPEAVLAAATSRAGEQIGLSPLGTLAEGAPADVIAVPGDARALRDDLGSPLVVLGGGRIVVAPNR